MDVWQVRWSLQPIEQAHSNWRLYGFTRLCFGVIKIMLANYNPDNSGKLFNEVPKQDFAEITDDERSEALQRLTLLADDAREDLD